MGELDYGTWRGIYTVLVFVLFIGVVWWAYSKGSKKRFEDAANSIFDEDDNTKLSSSKQQESKNDE